MRLIGRLSLHSNTHPHANNRQGLERRCRHGAHDALALERLSRMEDDRLACRMKHRLPDGTTRLFFTGLERLRRLASPQPPPRTNLTRFHGTFAPSAKVRPFPLPQAEGGRAGARAAEARLIAARDVLLHGENRRADHLLVERVGL
ncbi:transposase [Corallococcus sp. CA049B]|uniref:transposase n=1 Tax=Corallococcus sp. CA049B TaxID=2316730 RepID=UPI001F4790CD|nr:transposase [Corallococcus sp. CA049B]